MKIITAIIPFLTSTSDNFFYELFDCQEEFLQQTIMDEIKNIVSNDFIIIVAHDLKKAKRFSDQIFDKKETDGFGVPEFEKAMKRIHKKRV